MVPKEEKQTRLLNRPALLTQRATGIMLQMQRLSNKVPRLIAVVNVMPIRISFRCAPGFRVYWRRRVKTFNAIGRALSNVGINYGKT